jgi:hypothetical protein
MEGDSREHIKTLQQKKSGNMEHDDSSIFQPSWVRRNTILADDSNWKSLARQFRYVCYGGIILWTIHLISMALS